MSKKMDNFNQAMFEMFGVGNKPQNQQSGNATETLAQSAESTARKIELDAKEETVIPFPGQDGSEPAPAARPMTYLAPGTRMEGVLHAEGPVEVNGEFKGDIISEDSVIIHSDLKGNVTAKNLNLLNCSMTGDARVSEKVFLSEDSSINGNVRSGSLVCAGTIMGDLDVRHNLAMAPTAKVVGKVTTGTLTTSRGAIICGNVETRGDEEEG